MMKKSVAFLLLVCLVASALTSCFSGSVKLSGTYECRDTNNPYFSFNSKHGIVSLTFEGEKVTLGDKYSRVYENMDWWIEDDRLYISGPMWSDDQVEEFSYTFEKGENGIFLNGIEYRKY